MPTQHVSIIMEAINVNALRVTPVLEENAKMLMNAQIRISINVEIMLSEGFKKFKKKSPGIGLDYLLEICNQLLVR